MDKRTVIDLNSPRNIYKLLFPYMRGLLKYFFISVLAMVVVGFTGPLFASLLKPIIDNGFVEKNMDLMRWIPFEIVSLFIFRGIANYINEYTSAYISNKMVQAIQRDLFAKLMMIPVSYYQENNRGRMMSRIINDARGITAAGFDVITVFAKDGVTVFGLLIWLFYLDWQLTLITFITIPLIGWCVKVINKRIRKLATKSQNDLGYVMQILSESIDGTKVIRIYGGQQYEQERLEKTNRTLCSLAVRRQSYTSIGSAVTQLLIATSLSIILYIAANRAVHSGFTAGDFMSFLSAMLMMFDPLKRITNMSAVLQTGLMAASSVFSFLREPNEKNSGVKRLSAPTGDIIFKNVTLRYPNTEKNAVNNLNLTVKQGTVVALVGESGCGKTSTVNLIPRFYDITSGELTINDINIKDIELESLRRQMALVSQDVVLFNDTIANNIAYGAANVTESDIIHAAKAANAWTFIENLPDGLKTEVGDQGMKLSGGQRQRIAIARALLKDAPILILDEATSALDTESERLVQSALEELMKNRTTIVIAHRLSTIENADNIVVMHQGRIIEQGKHAELMDKNGRYAFLHRMQFGEK
ncbi:lipid A export permease/ATP-binding protein MsbA [Snodgrassella alvi]|uniref:Lipid A export permease/ATP-binding protein MsbA n=1 Tax=Snodgrassella alvi TaxID=1196083 RepID=A0A2N9XVS9_9NEIS|nr:lipid A export permease/ATP-binding protein MsbA [Snodgrassella alvi]PIT13613.1 lipid A export permease/ATP-binding protein MsbA [Snodgrassella alvi]PIT53669.1 lipid A export permease/ATP-binding protein MsbA [Snodgrassella alvi]